MGDIQFLPKAITIYSNKKTSFNYKKIYRSNKLAYFWFIKS